MEAGKGERWRARPIRWKLVWRLRRSREPAEQVARAEPRKSLAGMETTTVRLAKLETTKGVAELEIMVGPTE